MLSDADSWQKSFVFHFELDGPVVDLTMKAAEPEINADDIHVEVSETVIDPLIEKQTE
jgi:hypothetical protein